MRLLIPTPLPLLATLIVLTACAPVAGRTGPSSERSSEAPSGPKTLTLALNGEPDFLVLGIGGGAIAGIGNGGLQGAVHQGLATYDHRGVAHPRLATALPSQSQGTWVVHPDGTMRTTYTLRSGVTWHDGQPLRVGDFAFGWTVARDPEIPTSNRFVVEQIGAIETPDDGTLVIEWAKTYPFANVLVENQLLALPVHLIEQTYRVSKERFSQLGYWTRDFVGLGPYRLADWQAGSHLVLAAYDRFYAGQAKIDTVTVRFIPSEPTMAANLLAGSVDGILKGSLNFEDAVAVKQEWERMGQKPVLIAPTTHRRMLSVEFRPEIVSPREILDVRLRRALLHAIDRQAMVSALLAGLAPVSDTFIPPDDARWEWVQDVLVRYEYSPTRAQQLASELGWRPGSDGTFARASRESAAIEIRSTPGQEREIAIVADFWRAAGFAVEQRPLSIGESRDQRFVSLFPAFHYASLPLSFQHDLRRIYGRLCPTAQTNWTGTNRGCYLNPQMDAVADALQRAIDPGEQRRLWREIVRTQSEDLPLLPLYFNIQVELYREGVTGLVGTARPEGGQTWNIAEWDIL